ncbi:MAG TPA: DUF3810 domain-containing protein, partial [Tangfeifania sp.]|nr:DUF3810 domain-containing protein [Tangfeifania sp.]
PLLALLTFLGTEWLAANPQWTDAVYSRQIYPVFASILSAISAVLPFSLDDLFYILLIVCAFLLTGLLIFKKISLKKTGKTVLNIVAITYILFYLFWGFNYFRMDLNNRLELATQQPDTEDFLNVFEKLVEQTNLSHTAFKNFSKSEIDSLVEKSYQELSPVLQIGYPAGKRPAKNITFSRFFAQAGISGYYGPFFNEIHLNKNLLPVEYPFVLAHEKAHQFGITGESEANFYAWLVCTQSESEKLKYSANLMILRYFIFQGFRLEKFPEIIKKLDEPVKNDMQKIREHWANLRNEKIDRAATKMNDAYLKTNKIEEGVKDYRGVVKHVMDFSLDSAFQKKWNLNSE